MTTAGSEAEAERRIGGTVFRWLGRGLTVLALAFLVHVVTRSWGDIAAWRAAPADLAILVVGGAAQGAALFAQAAAFALLLRALSGDRLDLAPVMHAWSVTQLAKYLPGNAAHLVGRHLLLRRQGIGDRVLAKAAVLEVGFLVVGAALVVGTLLALTGGAALPDGLRGIATTGTASLAAALLCAFAWARRSRALGPRRAARIAAAFGLYLLFFAVFGLIGAALLSRFGTIQPSVAGAAPVAAWLAGFVTPGAPGGIGVREGALIVLLEGRFPPESLVLYGALLRLMTVLGDALCFGAGALLPRLAARSRDGRAALAEPAA